MDPNLSCFLAYRYRFRGIDAQLHSLDMATYGSGKIVLHCNHTCQINVGSSFVLSGGMRLEFMEQFRRWERGKEASRKKRERERPRVGVVNFGYIGLQ